jgi:hypothetical protein
MSAAAPFLYDRNAANLYDVNSARNIYDLLARISGARSWAISSPQHQ